MTMNNTIEVKNYTVNMISFSMIKVVGGLFVMGATSEQGPDFPVVVPNTPIHLVKLDDFYICSTPVTQALWTSIMFNRNPSSCLGANNPVDNVSWYYCIEFIKRLNTITGENFRLPTEAEWEYAARGGKKRSGFKYSGSNDIDEVAWYKENSNGTSHPVATKKPNELGIYDMSGNVKEWCQDILADYSSDYQINPKRAAIDTDLFKTTHNILRGGGYYSSEEYCRIATRVTYCPGCHHFGFRLAL